MDIKSALSKIPTIILSVFVLTTAEKSVLKPDFGNVPSSDNKEQSSVPAAAEIDTAKASTKAPADSIPQSSLEVKTVSDSGKIEADSSDSLASGEGSPDTASAVKETIPDGPGPGFQGGLNPFMSGESQDEEDFEAAAEPAMDILVDISRGISLSRVLVDPDYIQTKSKMGYVYDLGLKFPIKDLFFVGLGLRYYQLEYTLEEKFEDVSGGGYSINTTEQLNFAALPFDLGIRYDFDFIAPYIFAEAMPAVFVSGHYFSEENVTAVFPDRREIVYEKTHDRDITREREDGRYQIICGAGAGVDIPYGYGIIYLKGSCVFFLLDAGDNENNTIPVRTSSRIIAFPIALGLKFYL